jgi:hypothetical protein
MYGANGLNDISHWSQVGILGLDQMCKRCGWVHYSSAQTYRSPGTTQLYHPFWAYSMIPKQWNPKPDLTWSSMKPLMSPQLILKQLEWSVGHQVIRLNGQGGHSAVHLEGHLDRSLSCTTPWPTWPLRCRVDSAAELYVETWWPNQPPSVYSSATKRVIYFVQLNGQAGHWVCTAQWLSWPSILLQYSAIEFVEINGQAGFVNSTAKLWWVSTSQWIPHPVSWHSSMTKPILAGHWVLQTWWPSFKSGNCRDLFGYPVVQTWWLVVPAEWGLISTENHYIIDHLG